MELSDRRERLLGLLGLARRAGKLAVGASAVGNALSRGEPTLVIAATDMSPGQKKKLLRSVPQADLVDDVLDRAALSAAMGRDDLAVVAVQDRRFLRGIRAVISGS